MDMLDAVARASSPSSPGDNGVTVRSCLPGRAKAGRAASEDNNHVTTMEFAGFRLDTIDQCLWRRGKAGKDERTALTPKAFDVLRYLVEHAGRLVTQDEILSALWPESYVNPEVLNHMLE